MIKPVPSTGICDGHESFAKPDIESSRPLKFMVWRHFTFGQLLPSRCNGVEPAVLRHSQSSPIEDTAVSGPRSAQTVRDSMRGLRDPCFRFVTASFSLQLLQPALSHEHPCPNGGVCGVMRKVCYAANLYRRLPIVSGTSASNDLLKHLFVLL